MRSQTLLLALAVLALLGALPEEGYPQSAGADFPARDTVLSNGMSVIAVRNPTIPAATVVVAFRNGAFTQIEEKEEGLPHLMEHMLFQAYSGDSWSYRAGELDAAYNATTGLETVTYYLIVPRENVEGAIELLARLVSRPSFSRNDLVSEVEVVRNELERNATNPFQILDHFTNLSLYGSAFRQKNTLGNVLSILEVTTDDLRDHHRRYYVPNNAALIVTGDISHEEVFAAAREHLDSWDRGSDPFEDLSIPPVPPLVKDTVIFVEADAPDVTFAVAWQGPSESEDRDAAEAARLFSEIVTQRVSGAHQRLVDSGLFHFVSFVYQPSNRVGAIKLIARTVPEKIVAASRALRQEVQIMGSEGYFSDEDLQMAKASLRVVAALERESAISLAYTLADRWSLGGLEHYADDLVGEPEQSREGMRRFVSQYLTDRPRVLAVMVSNSTIQARNDALIAVANLWTSR